MCHVGLEVTADDHVPRGAVLTVEELLDVLRLLSLCLLLVDGDSSDRLQVEGRK